MLLQFKVFDIIFLKNNYLKKNIWFHKKKILIIITEISKGNKVRRKKKKKNHEAQPKIQGEVKVERVEVLIGASVTFIYQRVPKTIV